MTWLKRLPMFIKKAKPDLLIGPSVSMAIGTNSWVDVRLEYLAILQEAALSAAFAAEEAERATNEDAKVCVTVTSHVKHLPEAHGICVAPSGRFPSERSKPGGSFIAGTDARDKLR